MARSFTKCSALAITVILLSSLPLFAAAPRPMAFKGPSTKPTSRSASEGRVLHFPADRSLGMLIVSGEGRDTDEGEAWLDREYLGEATGDVTVPPGKRVILWMNDLNGDLSPLARLKSDDLHTLRLGRKVTESGLQHVAHLTGLKLLEFPTTHSPTDKVPGFGARSLKTLAGLKSLELLKPPADLTDAGLAAIVEALPQLKRLSFDRSHITDAGVAQLPRLKNLEQLYITGKYTSAGLAQLAEMPALQDVGLSSDPQGKRRTDDAMRELRKIRTLRVIRIVPDDLTDAGLAHLAGHPALESLDLRGSKVTDAGLAHLVSLPSLKKLNVLLDVPERGRPPITAAGIGHLKKIKTLEHLDLPNFGFTDADLAELSAMTQIKSLWIGAYGKSPFTDTGIKYLTRLQQLEKLTIGAEHLTDAGISSLASLPKLRSLTLNTQKVSPEGMARLAQVRSLERLHFYAETPVSALNRLNGMPRLRWLQLSGLVADGATLDIGRLPQLRYLMLFGPKDFAFRDEDMACLANLKGLKWIQMKTSLTDAGMTHLTAQTQLERLNLGGAGVTDHGLAVVANFTKLSSLNIRGDFTDEGLRAVEGLKGLTHLWLYSASNITPAAKSRLRKNLPNIYTFTVDDDQVIK